MPTLSTHATLTKEQELHWLALKMTSGLGTRTAYQLIQKLRTPEAIFRSSPASLKRMACREASPNRFRADAHLKTQLISTTNSANSEPR
jgi:predicted Rossmann fold nucleotide-binding protein DprA/Smf involved in DNA uptake